MKADLKFKNKSLGRAQERENKENKKRKPEKSGKRSE